MATDRAALAALTAEIVACRRCPRLVAWRELVAREKVARFRDEEYWGRPVPGFGDPDARILVLGLAPAAHGGNRTGRVFTGDASGDFLWPALHRAGLADRPASRRADDGLTLSGVYIAAAVRCAPPANKPTIQERDTCAPFLVREMGLLASVRVVLALGRVRVGRGAARHGGAWARAGGAPSRGSGTVRRPRSGRTCSSASYHPSQQNTFTGRLTAPMFDAVDRAGRRAGTAAPRAGLS